MVIADQKASIPDEDLISIIQKDKQCRRRILNMSSIQEVNWQTVTAIQKEMLYVLVINDEPIDLKYIGLLNQYFIYIKFRNRLLLTSYRCRVIK